MKMFGLRSSWIACGLWAAAAGLAGCGTGMAGALTDANVLAAETGKRTALRDAEYTLLDAVFGKSLDTSRIVLVYDSPLSKGASRTVENTIYFKKELDLSDESYRKSPEFAVLLVHEATHVWQFQNVGIGYIPDALFEQGVSVAVHGDRGKAYEYITKGIKALGELDTEQQAKLVEEYVGLALFGRKPFRAQDYQDAERSEWLQRAEGIVRSALGDQLRLPNPDTLKSQFNMPGGS